VNYDKIKRTCDWLFDVVEKTKNLDEYRNSLLSAIGTIRGEVARIEADESEFSRIAALEAALEWYADELKVLMRLKKSAN